MDLNEVLLEKVEEDFQKRRKEVVERSEQLRSLLIKIAKTGRWTLTTSVMGTETRHPEQEKDLDLLEKCGLVKCEVKYTKHNAYREYSVTEEGQAIVRHTLREI